MIVNLVRRTGNTMIREPLDDGVIFEGGEAQEGVLVTFKRDDREVTGRVIKLSNGQDPDSGPLIEIEEIDQEAQDAASERVLAKLPARSDFDTNI
jgi:hypothetical protein